MSNRVMSKRVQSILTIMLAIIVVFELGGFSEIARYGLAEAYADENALEVEQTNSSTDEENQNLDIESELDSLIDEPALEAIPAEDRPLESGEKESGIQESEIQPDLVQTATDVSDTENNVLVDGFIFDPAINTIVACSDIPENLVIPASLEVNGKSIPVRHIADGVFSSEEDALAVKTVSLPEGLLTIGAHAFEFNDINSLVLPASVTAIGDNAFAHNNLEGANEDPGLTISENSHLKSIGNSAFALSNMKEIDLSNASKLETIGENAFGHNYIKTAILPQNIKTINNEAFALNRLETVSIPDGIETLGAHVFDNCGRYVIVESNSNLVQTELTPGKFGSVVDPVSIWVQGIDS